MGGNNTKEIENSQEVIPQPKKEQIESTHSLINNRN